MAYLQSRFLATAVFVGFTVLAFRKYATIIIIIIIIYACAIRNIPVYCIQSTGHMRGSSRSSHKGSGKNN
jgi:hypothetical protein